MSKESFIGGDYIETTGGNNLNYAKGSITNSSLLQVTQTGKENGVTYNLNKIAPKIDGLANGFSYIIVVGTQFVIFLVFSELFISSSALITSFLKIHSSGA